MMFSLSVLLQAASIFYSLLFFCISFYILRNRFFIQECPCDEFVMWGFGILIGGFGFTFLHFLGLPMMIGIVVCSFGMVILSGGLLGAVFTGRGHEGGWRDAEKCFFFLTGTALCWFGMGLPFIFYYTPELNNLS